jgi:DNA-binding LytR/AlgR family response regulator
MKFKYIVIDDEPLARKLVISHASKIELLELSGECSNAIDAISVLRRSNADLIFLDIEMPELSGLELIKGLKNPPAIILITAHRDFAVEAFELNVVDYLVKPISFERFLKSADKFFDLDTSRFSNAVSQNRTIINIRADRKNFPVVPDEILFIESLDDYVKIHTKDKVLVTHENISTLEAKLPNSEFVRIHRSYLIAIQHITSFTSEFIEITGKQLPFGRAYKQIALKRLGYK